MPKRLLICVLAAALPYSGLADEPTREHKLELVPDTGEWREVPPPQPGTPEGDLHLARRLFEQDRLSKAKRAYRRWLSDHGDTHALARQAQLGLAEAMIAQRDFYKAHTMLTPYLLELSTDDFTLRAAELEFIVAESFLAGHKRKWLGMRILPSEKLGIDILDDISAGFPNSGLGELAMKTKADHYFNKGDYNIAEYEYGRMLSEYPLSRYRPYCTLRRAQATLAQFPGTRFNDAHLVEAEERYLRLTGEFPRVAEDESIDLILEDIRNRRAQKEYETGLYYIKVNKVQAGMFYLKSVIDHWPDTAAAVRAEAELNALGAVTPEDESVTQVEPAN